MQYGVRSTQYGVRSTQYAVRSPQYAVRSTLGGSTRLVGLIGWPVSHSLSPRLHNAAYAALGLDWVYVPLSTRPDRLRDALRGLVALGFAGANVTVPHKEAVVPFLDELSPLARVLGAVNTIVVREDGSLFGDSTDGAGFMADLAAHVPFFHCRPSPSARPGPASGPAAANSSHPSTALCSAGEAGSLSGQQQGQTDASDTLRPRGSLRVLLLGAGGAARAIAYALLAAGAAVAVVNRTPERGEKLCRSLADALPAAADRISAHPWPAGLKTLAAEADLIVNATSLGLREGDPVPWDVTVPFRPGQAVYDTIYNRPTELLALAQAQGARAINGLGMLIEQAARSAALWTGYDANLFSEIMRKELLAS